PAWRAWAVFRAGPARRVKPATLILHGDRDRLVALRSSRRLLAHSGPAPADAALVAALEGRLSDRLRGGRGGGRRAGGRAGGAGGRGGRGPPLQGPGQPPRPARRRRGVGRPGRAGSDTTEPTSPVRGGGDPCGSAWIWTSCATSGPTSSPC